MKKLTLIIAIVFSGILMQAQKNDFSGEIPQSLKILSLLLETDQWNVPYELQNKEIEHWILAENDRKLFLSVKVNDEPNTLLIYKVNYPAENNGIPERIVIVFDNHNYYSLKEFDKARNINHNGTVKQGTYKSEIIFNNLEI